MTDNLSQPAKNTVPWEHSLKIATMKASLYRVFSKINNQFSDSPDAKRCSTFWNQCRPTASGTSPRGLHLDLWQLAMGGPGPYLLTGWPWGVLGPTC